MNYTIEYPEKNLAVLTFTIDKDTFEADLKAAQEATQSDDQAKIHEYAIANAAGQTLAEAVKADNLKVAAEPSLISEGQPDGSVTVTINIPLVPEVTLPAYTGLNFEKEPATVTDEEVLQDVMQRIASQRIWKDVPVGTPAEKGDQVVIDFVGEKDGVPFPGGSAENFPLVLGSGQFIPGFEDQLIGAVQGEHVQVNVSFPEDYFEKSLAGQPVVFRVVVKQIQKPVVPELSDAFVGEMKLDGVKTVEELQTRARADMIALKEEEIENRLAYDILHRIAEGAKMDIPEAMIESQVNQHVQQYEAQLQQLGMSMEDFLKTSKQTMAQFKEKIVPEATEELRAALVLDAVAQAEQIKANDEEIQKEYELISTLYNFAPEQLKLIIPPHTIAAQITQRKTLDYLKEQNTVKK